MHKLPPLWWRNHGRDGVSNHKPHHCLLNRLFRRRSKKTSKLRVTGLCAGNWPGTGEFPGQMASNAENVSIWWRHHAVWHLCSLHGSMFNGKLLYCFSCKIIIRPGLEYLANFLCSIIAGHFVHNKKNVGYVLHSYLTRITADSLRCHTHVRYQCDKRSLLKQCWQIIRDVLWQFHNKLPWMPSVTWSLRFHLLRDPHSKIQDF